VLLSSFELSLPSSSPPLRSKLGQFIASSPTLFPEEYVTEFQKCFDKALTLNPKS